jgi:hypothetical protein
MAASLFACETNEFEGFKPWLQCSSLRSFDKKSERISTPRRKKGKAAKRRER